MDSMDWKYHRANTGELLRKWKLLQQIWSSSSEWGKAIQGGKNMSSTDLVSVALKKVIFPTHPNYFAIQDDLSCFTFTLQWMESVISVVTSN